MTRGGRRAWGALGAGLAVARCVRIDAAPNGVSSSRLDAAPPSIAIGDSLRDSLGVAVRVHGVAYDAGGAVSSTAAFRYSYVPLVPDTAPGAVVDTALAVDSATGEVRATARWVKARGRVVARIGGSVQLADTLDIVPRPDSLVATAAVDTLRYDCTDDRPTLRQRADTAPVTTLVNAVGPFTVVVRGDSSGVRVGVRRWLVRWSIDAAPAAVPTVTLASGAKVPAIAVATSADALLSYDTTTTAGTAGTSSVLLRIRPTALGPAYSADSLFEVRLRADVIAGRGVAVAGSPARVFSVLMRRSSRPVVANVASCPR